MIDFMIIAGPRSGTTWAANWLCTDTSHCVHDPIANMMPEEIDNIPNYGKTLGVSCTALGLFTDFLNSHPARKVVLHRPTEEINSSLSALGYPIAQVDWSRMLHAVKGVHVPWTALFNNPEPIYHHLLQKPFDPQRHAELVNMQVQPNFEKIQRCENTLINLVARLKRGA